MNQENKDIQKLLTDLFILGRLGTGYKLNTKDSSIILDESTWYQGFLRKYRGDDRNQTLDFIKKCIDRCSNLSKSILLANTDNDLKIIDLTLKDFTTLFTNALTKARVGLDCLKITYNSDAKISESLNLIIIQMDNIIMKLTKEILL